MSSQTRDNISQSVGQCGTIFENHQCQGIKGHGGCCQDIDYSCVEGEQYTYINGKNWCNTQIAEYDDELK